jgi:hypothetical protein
MVAATAGPVTKPQLSRSSRCPVVSSPVHLNQVHVSHHPKSVTKQFPRCVHFSHVEVFDIPRVGSSRPVDRMSKATKRSSSDRPHGTSLDVVEECYRALRRAVELSEELALGTDVVVAACPKSPRSRVCDVQPDAWLIDTGSGHDLVDFALVLGSAQLIETAHKNIVLHTANGECRPNGSIVMDVKPLNETSSALVLENTPNVLSVGLRCMEYGYSFHWPSGQVPYLVTPDGFRVDCEVENNVPTLSTARAFPQWFAVPAPKSRLEEALSRPVESLASGRNVPASEEGSVVDSAGEGNALASGDLTGETLAVPPRGADTTECDESVSSSDDEIDHESRRDLRAEALSIRHLLTHQPKNKYCKACTRCKMQRTPCKRGASSSYGPKPENFGDICTCDHIIAYDELSKGINGEQEALVIVDIATGWMFGYPVKTKSAKDVIASVIDFSPLREIKLMHSDPAPELRAAMGSLEIAFESAPVGVKGANGVAERMVRTVVEGTRTLLENAGLPLVYWPFAMKCFCLLYNVTHAFPDGSTPWTRRHDREFGSLLIPFGCLVDFKPTVEETKKLPKFSPQAVPGVFLGYDLSPGGQWKRVCLVVALEDFRDADFTRVGPRPCPHIHRTRDVCFDSTVAPFFPLKVMYDVTNRAITGSPAEISKILIPFFSTLPSSHPPPVSSEGGAPDHVPPVEATPLHAGHAPLVEATPLHDAPGGGGFVFFIIERTSSRPH